MTKVLPTNDQAGPLMTFFSEGRTVPAELAVVAVETCFWSAVKESVLAASLEADHVDSASISAPATNKCLLGRSALRNMPKTITSIRAVCEAPADKTVDVSKLQEETSPSGIIRPFQAAAVALAVACCGVAIALQRFLDAHPGVVFVSLALVISAFVAVWGVAVGEQSERRAATLGLAGFLVGVSVLLALSSGVVAQGDESLFTRFATEILRHGGNPYVHNAVLAALHYGAPVSGVTATWDQSFVGVYPYPAGLLWLTWVASAVPFFATPTVALNALAVVGVTGLLKRHCGWSVASLYALIIMTGEQMSVLARGNSDIAVVPFLIWLVAALPSLGVDQRRRVILFGAVLGLALSVKQNAWLVAPFVVIALWRQWADRDERPLRPILQIAAVATTVFLACNLPFIVRDSSAWWNAVVAPFRSNLVPAGQGLIMIPMHFGGDLSRLFSVLPIVAYALTLLIAFRVRGRLSLVMVMSGVIPTLVSGRSFLHYLITLTPLALVALSVKIPTTTVRRRSGAILLLLPVLFGAVLLYQGRTAATEIQLKRYVVQSGSTQVTDLVVRVSKNVVNHASSYVVSHDGNPFQQWVVATQDGNLLTLHAPAGATPLFTTTPFQVAAIDSTSKFRYVSAPLSIAPLSVFVTTTPPDATGQHRFRVTLQGPSGLISRSIVRVGQTEVVRGGIQTPTTAEPYVFAGRAGPRGSAAWMYRCDPGAQSKVYVQVIDRFGQIVYQTPTGLFVCDSPISDN